MILKRLKPLPRTRVSGVIEGLAAFGKAALPCHSRHQVAKPDCRGTGLFQKIEGNLVSHCLVAPPRGKKSPLRRVGAADQHAGRGIAAAACGNSNRRQCCQRRVVACLLQFVIKPLHVAFADMAELMRHHAKKLSCTGGLFQKAGMHIDDPLSGDKGVI